MSLHALAHHMAEKGRGPDSMLVHMSPDEIQSLQALAMANGGSLTINPQTGLPEAGFLDSLLPALVGFGLNTFLPGLGTAVGGIFGLGGAAGTAIAVGGATALASGDLSKGLMAGLGAYGGAGLGESLTGVPNTAADPGWGARDAGISEAAKTSPEATFNRMQSGVNAAVSAPTDFLKSNYMNLGYAAAPALSGAFEEEETSTAPKRNYGNIPLYKVDPVTGKSYVYKSIPGEQASTAPGIVWGNANGGLMNSYAPGGRIEDEYTGLPYELPENNPVIEGTTQPQKSEITDDAVKKGMVWGNVLAPDLTGHDLNDRRSDSQKAQDYLMGRGPNPFVFTSKTPVVDATKKAADATKEIAATVEQQKEQQRGGGGNAGVGPSGNAGVGPSGTGGFPAGLAPAANKVAQVLGDMGLNTLSHAVSNVAMSGAMSGSGAAPGSSAAPNAGAVNGGESGGWGSRDAGGFSGPSGGSGNGPSGVGHGDQGGAHSGQGPGAGGGDGGGHGDARGGYLAHGQFDQRYAYGGGITALADGGMYNLGSYSDGGRLLRGPGDGVSDSIPAVIGRKQPARLADGEFVVPARIVSELGNGSTEAGARKLYAMMDRVQKARHRTVGKNKIAANTRAEKYLPA